MAVCGPFYGKYVDLVSAAEEDAEFTLALRNDPELTQFIPRVYSTIEKQKKWINEQREAEQSAFFIIKNKAGWNKGTLSFYDVEEKHCELGRLVSQAAPIENVEAVILLLDYLFDEKGIEYVVFNIDKRNTKVISLWKKFGAQFVEDVRMDGWVSARHHLYRDRYREKKRGLAPLLKLG